VVLVGMRVGEKDGRLKHLLGHTALAGVALDAITAQVLGGFIEKLRQRGYPDFEHQSVATGIAARSAVAAESGKIDRLSVKIQTQPGEKRRERTLYLRMKRIPMSAAGEIGESILQTYEKIPRGIRASQTR
jgi:hypothetical protein